METLLSFVQNNPRHILLVFAAVCLLLIVVIHLVQYIQLKLSPHQPFSAEEVQRATSILEQQQQHNKIHLITFGDGLFREQSEELANFFRTDDQYRDLIDCVTCYHSEHIDETFRETHQSTLKAIKGLGYWLWKPYFCERYWRENVKDGDVFVYIDGGLVMRDTLKVPIAHAISSASGGYGYQEPLPNHEYCKADVFEELQMDISVYGPLCQFMGGFFCVQKRPSNVQFFQEFLQTCEKTHILDDTPSKASNHPSFHPKKHRNDQAIFSLLAWKYQFGYTAVVQGECSSNKHCPYYRKRPWKHYIYKWIYG
jgi:hypothetical protein